MKKSLIGLSIVSSIMLLTACGGSNGGGDSTVTGQLIDGVVEGADYECSGGSTGTTNSSGEFTCNVGNTVTFSVAGVEIGSATAKSQLTPYDLTDTDEAAVNLAQFLQTLDDDKNPSNGIKLDSTTNKFITLKNYVDAAELADTDIGIDFKDTNFDTVVGGIIGEALVDGSTAKTHMDETIASFTDNDDTTSGSSVKQITVGHLGGVDFSEESSNADWEQQDGYTTAWSPTAYVSGEEYGSGLWYSNNVNDDTNTYVYIQSLGEIDLDSVKSVNTTAWHTYGTGLQSLQSNHVYVVKTRDGYAKFKVTSLTEDGNDWSFTADYVYSSTTTF